MLSHQQIMQRQRVLRPATSSNNISAVASTSADANAQKGFQQIDNIQNESGEPGLLRALQALVLHLREEVHGDKSGKNFKQLFKKVFGQQDDAGAIGYTPSHEPEGAAWTLGALIQNLEAVLHLSPTNTKAIKELLSVPLSQQPVLIRGIIERLLSTHVPVNDRHGTFEAVMKILGTMGPEQDDLIFVISQPLIETYYNDIPKPFINFVGYNYRSADGSYNSYWFPNTGKAGTNYMRAITSTSLVPDQLPDPKEVFDRILKRTQFTPHPTGVNMLLFYLAIIITHDLFYTDPRDPFRNLTTSYLDMSPLYGFNREDQLSVRQMKKGLLKPDQWFDKRLMIQPPGVAALMVLFSRNHNYIAKRLLVINEHEQFSYGPGKMLANGEEQDEKLFQTARLINNGCFVNIILHEYVRTVLGIPVDAHFVLDPLATPSSPVYGNAVSIEFNFIYRWHMGIGQEDAEWVDSVMRILGPQMAKQHNEKAENPVNELGTDQSAFEALLPAFNDAFVHASPQELELGLPIAGAHRKLNTGEFSDFDITKMLRRGYTQIASQMGNGLNTPAALEQVEIAGIIQGRKTKTCSLNDMRRHLNLTPLTSFEDFSERPEVQQALKELYGSPDNVELYTGLMVERNMVTGLQLPYTMGRAILSDAINLVRNDRIVTQELTPLNMTNWGYQYYKGNAEEQGRVLPTMLRTLLPEANANGHPAFSQEEMNTLFNVPGSKQSNANTKKDSK